MLYLEDYLEMIEHLPQELRDRFTELREMDLSVQNNMDTLEKRVRVLFGTCRRGEINKEQADAEFAEIMKGYNKTIEETDEKVALSNQMYELVDRYLRKLDTELHKFKCELEADNKGITEVLEKRSLELDVPNAHSVSPQNNHYKENKYRIRSERRRESWNTSRDSSRSHPTSTLSRVDSALQQTVLGRDSYGTISPAVNQTITATQQLQGGVGGIATGVSSVGGVGSASGGGHARRSVKQYDGIGAEVTLPHYSHSHALHDHGSYSGQNLAPSSVAGHSQITTHGHHTITAHGHTSTSSNKRHSKPKKTNSYSSAASSVPTIQQSIASASRSSSPSVTGLGGVGAAAPAEEALTDTEWTYDPNEPRYCLCNQVSYGDMVACDNADCPYEWFHYPCVGITAPPKGKWYCPRCHATMRRNRPHRKN